MKAENTKKIADIVVAAGATGQVASVIVATIDEIVEDETGDAFNRGVAEGRETEVCPYDCDNCHSDECPCDRLGCAGSKLEPRK